MISGVTPNDSGDRNDIGSTWMILSICCAPGGLFGETGTSSFFFLEKLRNDNALLIDDRISRSLDVFIDF
jgi:hypothetical protein